VRQGGGKRRKIKKNTEYIKQETDKAMALQKIFQKVR
jgi:hypothetical protein